jgi:hypothetical protein
MAKIVAFSLPIDLNQLNEVYELYIAGVSREDARTRLDEQISQHLSSKDTIRKTRTILLNVWYDGQTRLFNLVTITITNSNLVSLVINGQILD